MYLMNKETYCVVSVTSSCWLVGLVGRNLLGRDNCRMVGDGW